jgi:hypothetical protein
LQIGYENKADVNEYQKAGEYIAVFNARLHGQGSGLASGIYFYKLVAGDFSEIKRMILVK